MRTLVAALVLATASLVGAQVWVAPRQGPGGRDAPGTLQNPYIVYDHGFPTMQLNTPQMGAPPPNQPVLLTPLGRPLGSNSATRSVAAAFSASAATRAPTRRPGLAAAHAAALPACPAARSPTSAHGAARPAAIVGRQAKAWGSARRSPGGGAPGRESRSAGATTATARRLLLVAERGGLRISGRTQHAR